jgi:hypothetical protein
VQVRQAGQRGQVVVMAVGAQGVLEQFSEWLVGGEIVGENALSTFTLHSSVGGGDFPGEHDPVGHYRSLKASKKSAAVS